MTALRGVALLTAAGIGLTAAAASAQSVTMWTWRQQEIPLWEKVSEITGIDVTVETFRPTEYNEKLQIAMNAGTGPDFIQGRGGKPWLDPFAEAGLFAEIATDVNYELFPAVAVEQVTATDGKRYGVPFAFQTSHFIYNPTLFEQAGVTPPETWDQFWTLLDDLKAAGITPLYAPGREAWALNILSGILDASILGDDGARALQEGEACFTDAPYLSNLQRMDRMQAYFQDGFSGNDTNDLVTAFALGQTAMVPYGIFGISQMQEINPDLTLDMFLAPPVEDGGEAQVYAWPDGGYYVNATSENRDAAMKLAQFAATPEFGQLFIDLVGEIPAVKGSYATENAVLTKAITWLNDRPLSYMTWVRTPFDYGDPRLYTLLSNGLQEMYADQITPEDLAAKIQDGLNGWYPAFQDGQCPRS